MKIEDAIQLVKDLAAWSNKYPRGQYYHPDKQPTMDEELIALEERAKELVVKLNKVKTA